MQACGARASAALAFRASGHTQPCCMSLTMNKPELFGQSPQLAHGPGFQYGFRANHAVSRDATYCNQQDAECKWVGEKRTKILGKLLKPNQPSNVIRTLAKWFA